MEKRIKSSVVTLVVGLVFNILLGVGKLVVGILDDSVSVTSDALNNLSDAAVSVVTILATWLAARKADRDHPFGHGRYEYIAAFVVSAAILLVGGEAAVSGVKRIITPVAADYGIALWSTLGAAIAVKAIMSVMYFASAKKTGSTTLKAAAVDSASDAAVTSVVLCCAIAQKYTGANIDGYASVAVAIVIFVFAIRMLRSTVSRLLGERPDPALYDAVRDIVCAFPGVLSVHDIMINDYGAQKTGEADAVFPADMSFVAVHDTCDKIERAVREKTGIRLTVHADPMIDSDARLVKLRERITEAVAALGATVHDLAIDDEKKLVEFDVTVSSGSAHENEITAAAKAAAVTVVDHDVKIHVDYI